MFSSSVSFLGTCNGWITDKAVEAHTGWAASSGTQSWTGGVGPRI